MKNRLLIIALLCLCFTRFVYGQQDKGGKIEGIITSGDKPVEAATIQLFRLQDTVALRNTTSDKAGSFLFEKIDEGQYIIAVAAIGFEKYTSDSIRISKSNLRRTLSKINLKSTQNELGGVVVKSTRPFIENKIDKTVVNVDAAPTNAGLNALELLEKSPGVTVDNDGNVSLKGKNGVTILIDGKPSYLSSQELANYLKNLPANQLDQIEIMTQPSAKYDAAGNSGVINIKTKKNKNNGFNMNLSTSAIIAQYFKNTSSINANWRKDKVNVFGNYGYSEWIGYNDLTLNRSLRTAKDIPFNRYSDQYSFNKYASHPNNYKAGIDYYLSKKTTIGVVVNGQVDNNRSFGSNSLANIYDSLKQFAQYNDAKSQTSSTWKNTGANLNFSQKFGKESDKELTADLDYIKYKIRSTQHSDNYLYNADSTLAESPYLLKGNLPSDIDIYSIKSDYKHPMKKNFVLEAGFKSSYVKTDNDAQYTRWDAPTLKWMRDADRSNHFIYKENINAVYVNLQKQIKKFSLQAGLRVEQTIAKGEQTITNENFDRNYTDLFPTAYINYKANDNNTWGISYGRRIQRPDYEDLNPFIYPLDRFTYQKGNPNLNPQFSDNIELSYNYKGQINLAASYTKTNDIINDVIITEKDGDNYVSFQTKTNIADNTNIGFSANYNKPLTKWWTMNLFATVYYVDYKGIIDNEQVHNSITTFNSNINNQFTFKKGWAAELSGWYISKFYDAASLLAQPMGMFSIGGSKKFLKDKAAIKMTLRDPFYLLSFEGNSNLKTANTYIKSTWDNRRLVLTFTYRFGKNGAQVQERKRSSQDEQNRVKSNDQQ